MQIKKMTAGVLAVVISLTMVSFASANSAGNIADPDVIWITQSNQVSALGRNYFIFPMATDTVNYTTSGQLYIDFDDDMDLAGVAAGTDVLVDWSNNANNIDPTITTTTGSITVTNTGNKNIVIPFTITGSSSITRAPVVEIRDVTNAAAAETSSMDFEWRHGDGTTHNTIDAVTKVMEQTANTQTVTVLRKIGYVLGGDASLTYQVEPSSTGGVDTNSHTIAVQTNADTYTFKVYRPAGSNWTSVDGTATNGGGLGGLPLDGTSFRQANGTALAPSGEGFNNGTVSPYTSITASTNSLTAGFGIRFDNSSDENNANVQGPTDLTGAGNGMYSLPNSNGNSSIIMQRSSTNQWAGRNTTDDATITYQAVADYTVDAGDRTLTTTYDLAPSF